MKLVHIVEIKRDALHQSAGMELTLSELMAPIFYFMNEKKHLCQLQ